MIRILHVLGGMNRGGIETWLMNVMRRIDREQFQIDFLVHTQEKCAFDEELLSMGCRIIAGGNPRRPFQYALRFFRILREYGPYDIVHSHVHYYSGYILFLAILCGIPARIAHSHNDTSHESITHNILRKWYITLTRAMIHLCASLKLAISQKSACDLYGENWNADSRCTILHYGIDLTQFQNPVDRNEIRLQLGIPENAFVLGHIGRMVPQKNHEFLIQITKQARQIIPNAKLLLVGGGPLRVRIEQLSEREDLGDAVIFAGVRHDIPNLLRTMDVFLFPSRFEGFGLVVLEAQACGLPCLISDQVPQEVIITNLVKQQSLHAPPQDWAQSALELYQEVRQITLDPAFEIKKQSFDIASSIEKLENIYLSMISKRERTIKNE